MRANATSIRAFAVFFRYKTRPRFRKGTWKAAEKTFAARDRMEALRIAKEYAEKEYRGQWVLDVCQELEVEGESS